MNWTLAQLPMPLLIVPPEPMDDDALWDFCHANDLYKIERTSEGEIRVMSPSGGGTSNLNAAIISQLWIWTLEDGRGISFDSNGGFRLPDGSMLSPDGAWVEREQWNALTEQQQTRWSPICPSFIIELRSATDRRKDLENKMEIWLANGAQVAWLIDPKEKSVSIYRANEPAETLFDPTSVQGTGPVSGFTLVMNSIWG